MTRLALNGFGITGDEKLGIEESPYYGCVSLPPVLDAQIGDLCIRKIDFLSRKVLSTLPRLITNFLNHNWFEAFLTIAILVMNLEFISEHSQRQIKYQPNTVSRAISV